jgi:hypothetical protein
MFLLWPKFPFVADPESVMELRLSAPIAFDAAATMDAASWAFPPIDTTAISSAAPANLFSMRSSIEKS